MKWSRNLRILNRSVRIATRLAKASVAPTPPSPAVQPSRQPRPGRLTAYEGFGDNPGRLRMLAHVPNYIVDRPLVVLLHGCGQNAARFALGSCWIAASERLGFPLVLPEQTDGNNPGRCFQWFEPDEMARGQGEAASIAAITRSALARFNCDPARVFIVGLSAGGAMAAAMLAAYPDLFAAGAVVAGLPVGAAHNRMEAILRMASPSQGEDPSAWANRSGSWPRLSVWHGLNDTTVAPGNGAALADQWRALHGLNEDDAVETVRPGGARRLAWPAEGQPVVEYWTIPGFRHAYPVLGEGGKRDFIENAPVDATAEIGRFFGLD